MNKIVYVGENVNDILQNLIAVKRKKYMEWKGRKKKQIYNIVYFYERKKLNSLSVWP